MDLLVSEEEGGTCEDMGPKKKGTGFDDKDRNENASKDGF